MKVFLYFVVQFICGVLTAPSWMDKHISSPIEYTVYNEVSVVHNTKIDYDDFIKTIP